MAECKQQLNNLKNIRDPYRCLSLAVVANAIAEDSPDSVRWLQGQSEGLRFWCEAAQIPIDKLHKRMREGI
jgi:hypothetical protein